MIRRLKKFQFDLSFPSEQPKVFQRLGETQATDIEVQILSNGEPYSLTGVRFGFEMRDCDGKIVIDEEQSKFSIVDSQKGKFNYRVDNKVFGFKGNAYLCYFVLKISDVRITTERFIITNNEDVQTDTTGLREHYVSVIDDLVKSNKEAMDEAKKIKDMIEANQVVKKTGDTMTGNLLIDRPNNTVVRDIRWTTGGTSEFQIGLDSGGLWRGYSSAGGNIFSYNTGTKAFNIDGATNVLKKSGDKMDGVLSLKSEAQFTNADTGRRTRMFMDNSNGTAFTIVTEKTAGQGDWDWQEHLRVGDRRTWMKNSGDTISGDFKLTRPNATTARTLRWDTAGVEDVVLGLGGSSKWLAWDQKNAKGIFEYDPTLQTFNVTATNTNVLKKTGDTMNGTLSFDAATAERNITWKTSVGDMGLRGKADGVFSFRDWGKSIDVFTWDGSTFSVNGNTNLLKKTGDTMTGSLTMENNILLNAAKGAARTIRYRVDGNDYISAGLNTSGDFAFYDQANSKNIWNYLPASNTFNVLATNTNLVKTDKDGKVDIIPSTNAEATAGVPQFALRRGNTVTISIDLTRKAGTTSHVVATLPTGMRPPMDLFMDIIAVDGTPARFLVKTNGEIQINATGKQFRTFQTYVVD